MKKIALIFGFLFCITAFAQNDNTKYYDNGQVKMETTKVGDRMVQTIYYKTGEVKQVGTFKDNKPNGIWKTYATNGDVISEGYYENGLKSGKWVIRTAKGNTQYELYYENGKRVDAVVLK